MDERTRLQVLLDEIQRLSDQHWNLLDRPLRAMGDQAWVGPSARAFDADLERSHRDLRERLRESVDLVRARLHEL